MDLREWCGWLALALWMAVDISTWFEVGVAARKVGFGTTEFEAKDPRLAVVDVEALVQVIVGETVWEEQDVVASKAFVDLGEDD